MFTFLGGTLRYTLACAIASPVIICVCVSSLEGVFVTVACHLMCDSQTTARLDVPLETGWHVWIDGTSGYSSHTRLIFSLMFNIERKICFTDIVYDADSSLAIFFDFV
jgi:hypothetical protein